MGHVAIGVVSHKGSTQTIESSKSSAWYHQLPRFSDKPGQSVLAALNQSGLPGVPAAFQEVIDSGFVRESMQTGTCPRWTNDSRTPLRVLANRPGLPHRE